MVKRTTISKNLGNRSSRYKQVFISSSMFVRLSAMVLFVILSVGCSTWGTSEAIYRTVSTPTLTPGEAVPVPENDAMLTVTGKIGTTNQGGAIVMDRQTIEDVGLVEYEVHDPFENRPIVYRGVLVSELLALWQVADDVEAIRFTALNDYQVDIPIKDFQQYPVLFAMQADGVYMEPSYHGPAMLVYPLDHYDLDILSIKSRWIWQIKSVELL